MTVQLFDQSIVSRLKGQNWSSGRLCLQVRSSVDIIIIIIIVSFIAQQKTHLQSNITIIVTIYFFFVWTLHVVVPR